MRWLNEERGVAAMTVLLVTFVMAIAGAVVLFSATTDLETAARDTRAEEAFTTAEGGLDLAATYIFENPTFSGTGQTEMCLDNPLVPTDAGFSCEAGGTPEIEITSPSNGRFVYPTNGRPFIEYRVISRSKEGTTVTRTLGATYRVEALDLPFGMFVNGAIDLNGNPTLFQESLLVNGPVTSREKVLTDFNNNDLFDDPDLGWRFHKDRIQSTPDPTMCFDPSTEGMVGCAGVFSNFQIYEQNQQKNQNEEHYPCSTNCLESSRYPIDRDSHHTKLLGGVPQPVVTIPTDKILEPMEDLKRLAQQQGLYFNYKNGQNNNVIIQPGDIGAPAVDFEKNAVVYIDADAGDSIGWKVNLDPPPGTGSDMLYTDASGQRVSIDSGVLVVRGGMLRLESNTLWSGAIFAPEGEFRILGGAVCTCTVYAQGFSAQGGGSTIQLVPDWFNRLPGGLVSVRRTAFYECEQYQESAVCPPD